MKRLSALIFVTGVLASSATASDVEIASLGTHLYGPELAMSDLEGRVVLIEKWGVN